MDVIIDSDKVSANRECQFTYFLILARNRWIPFLLSPSSILKSIVCSALTWTYWWFHHNEVVISISPHFSTSLFRHYHKVIDFYDWKGHESHLVQPIFCLSVSWEGRLKDLSGFFTGVEAYPGAFPLDHPIIQPLLSCAFILNGFNTGNL